MPHLQDLIRTAAAVMVCLALNSCDEQPLASEATQSLTVVATVKVQAETLPLVSELPGRIAPMMTADVRPRVTGMVLKRVFEQGSTVKQGDVLYLIDREPFEAKVESAQATLDSAVAAQLLARQQAERQTLLQQKGVASSQDSESAVAKLAQSDADVARAHADLKTARLDLQYTDVRAPISGAIGRALVTEGTLVSPTSDVLATIQRINPVYADFTQPASTLITLKNAVVQGKLQADASGSAVLRLISEDGNQYPYEGKLLFSEATVNSATGQVILRGEFPNPDRNLLPGMYVRTRIEQGSLKDALAVPQQAVQRDTAGQAQLYVVDADGKVQIRPVSLGWELDGRWIVLRGVAPGDEVIVEGFQKIAPGSAVKTEPWVNPAVAQADNSRKG
ncbi:efflux RND transporter periplasmic adaptor subunit [Agrobacterium rhizogenes]|uniref:efflux RND transporter periplasmic adaptor subunit n=1 Tax=Rhizobium rhizogenes TaxID=359 RepID=UPI0015744CFB|nr:efflux RND transporter periplasmic adaptor subunit [Rhizobium rhizogenes]NTF52797.1 efflux RND transporter periplasmic adaptor subunit [Rhizobium rhizogenes]NTG04716.1 efflux RND transporter periplasmic adaptor subunit [Rhizobium rhizogenes]NTG31904.1 efflux RND transporter periplasmic adaptor subunit [Rhizobium rhizogenes]NTG38932.1 efflux RND transporter periplasmic adaptor subunit [Rhizobium rhizogenes]NTG58056.1 efflux RND transporter periplasmic adaptor subunit [Rhizobium rhizogenes]